MSKFIELSSEEQCKVNGGGVTDVMDAIGDWLAKILGLYDEDHVPIIH